MSADKPGKGPGKPFLADDDLANELDAWDQMFDGLHAGPESGGVSNEQPMAWPEPAPPAPEPVTLKAPATTAIVSRIDVERAPEPALTEAEVARTVDEVLPAFEAGAEIDLDAQMTLDNALVEPPARPSQRFAERTWDEVPNETDFSDAGIEGAPAALGEMLGASPPPFDVEPEEEVYTSASRPRVRPADDDLSIPSDPIAPPPVAARTRPPSAPPKRTGPAIIRRTPLSVPIQRPPIDEASNDFAETTRILDAEEIEAHANAARGQDARSKAPTAPPPMAFTPADAEPAPSYDDDYADIEIGADAAEPAVPEPAPAPVPQAPPARRTVAHVVRRAERTTKQPLEQARPSAPKIEVHEPAAPVEIAEDDFSDVAAAVGAEELAADAPAVQHSTLRGARAESPPAHVIQIDDEDAQIDDHLPTTALPDEVDLDAVGDAYVPMGSRLDDALDVPHEEAPASGTLLGMAVSDAAPPPAQPARPALADFYPRVKTPTSVPPIGQIRDIEARAGLAPTTPRRPPLRLDTPITEEAHELEPVIDLEAVGPDSTWPEQLQPLPSSQLDEDAAQWLMVYEREIQTVDDLTASAALRIEAGRLSERLGEHERARGHYDAALLADPRATAALRGLRRLARASSDLVEATRQLDAEIAVAGALERRPLGHYRVDLLLASGEQDLARVAAGELLDTARSDVRALLAQLELAFLDGRADEFGSALEQLAHAVTDNELRGAVQSARAVLAAHGNDHEGAAAWFAAAAESDPGSLSARLGAIRQAAAQGQATEAAQALLELARQIEQTDPATASAIALRAQHWAGGELAVAAGQLAANAMPADPLIARVAAETAITSGDAAAASAALAAWAACPGAPAERAYAAGRAAELDPARGAELWGQVVQLDAGDDYAAAQLRTAYVAAEATQLAIEVDLSLATDAERDRARLRAAFGMIAQGQLDQGIDVLQKAHTERPGSVAMAEALAEALAAAGRWSERAELHARLAKEPGEQLDKDVAQLRSALAWEEAVGAIAGSEQPDADALQRTTAAALDAWEQVIEQSPTASPSAHAAAIVLASRLGDREVLDEVLGRAQSAERSPWAASSLALRRARAFATDDAPRAEMLLREPIGGIDDPRRTVWLELAAARKQDLGDAAAALEERAGIVGDTSEGASLRLRAAQLALDAGDAARAAQLLVQVKKLLPELGIVSDLLSAARRRSGDRSGPVARIDDTAGQPTADAFARIVRDADYAVAQGDGASAITLYQRALEMRPGDPIAAQPLVRLCAQQRNPDPVAALALAQLKAAEASGDQLSKAEAYELLAWIDRELRADSGAAQVALESASQADPTRIDLMHRLEREYSVGDQLGELLRLRRAELAQLPLDLARDRAAVIMDTASLAERDRRPDVELTELYREALAAAPKHRLALMQLETIVRRAGASTELATLEEQIANYFDGDARAQAAFFTRAGETLAELGDIDTAVQKFGRAEEVQPGHVPALEGWRQAALKGQLWIDVAEAAQREAKALEGDPDTARRAALYHFAGVALMDKALVGEQAVGAFRKALELDPAHKDAFLRLRILLEEDANHDELAILLSNRLEHEPEGPGKLEIHRAVAELARNFLGDRETAKKHYREILTAEPNDLRAHAAVADIAWEQGAWQEAADALVARARLERDPDVLKTLCFRLGLIYADRIVDVPMALKAFQRALTYAPDDEATLVRLADLATAAGEWKLALGACERLVKSEQDPEKRASHLHRVAKIFKSGFGDQKRAERALNLALDGAPTSDEALSHLVQFYRDAGDMVSVRVHLNRVAGTMRNRAAADPKDGVAYRVIARAMAARAAAGVDGSLAIARAAAELATLLGETGEPERLLLAETPRIDLAPLLRSESDELLFPRSVQPELRQLFTLLGDRVAKHVGVDLRAYGVGRGDRLRAKDSSVAAHAQDVATGLGFGEIDVYVSTRQPFAMAAEPTSPVSLVIGQGIAEGGPRAIRFAAGAALKLAQASLAIPARLPAEDLGVLVVALLRLFQPEFPGAGLDADAITTQMQKLKRLIPTGLSNELKPFALAVDAGQFDAHALARDLRIAGLRAGLVASASLLAGLNILAAQAGADVPSFLADPVAQGLITFALGEDHAAIAR